jgi:hypothetical protein
VRALYLHRHRSIMAPYRYLALLFLVLVSRVFASEPDIWNVASINVTASSQVRSGFSILDIFGAQNSTAEPGDTIFLDGQPNSYVHYVEWQTANPVTLGGIKLRAGGDGPIYSNQREFATFVLKAKLHPGDPFTTVYTFYPTHPYTFVEGSTTLISSDVTGINAQYFRAEFVQWNSGRGLDGPRIIELEGYAGSGLGTPAPPDVQPEPTHITPSTEDLFDVHQGAQVLTASPTITPPDGFLGNNAASIETGSTLFQDGPGTGFVHFVEWKTARPIQLNSFNLFAGGDGPTYNNEREFDQFTLKAKLRQSDNYVTIYSAQATHPYTLLDSTTYALFSAAVAAAPAQFFRAEFTQINMGRGFDGPRVMELDGFGSYRDAPADGGSGGSPGTPPPSILAISPTSGTYSGPISVVISNTTTTSIRYTLDGSEPAPTSQLYAGPLNLSASATVKARAFSDTNPVSDIVSATYTLTTPSTPSDPSTHIRPATDDLFDVRKGAQVLATSSIWSGFFQDGMLGNDNPSAETGSTVFADGQPNGFVHYIEWKTAQPIKLSSFTLFAGGDGPIYNNEREFDQFVLKAKLHPSDEYVTIYTHRPTHPYTFLDSTTDALLSAAVSGVPAQFFRAEFTQINMGRGYDGPRVLELDGFGTPLGWSLGDGIPDTWRLKFFNSIDDPNAAAIADPDGDGSDNYQEYLDGTNPLFADAVFAPLLTVYPPDGSYPGPLDVQLAGRGESSLIHYTLDGSDPSNTSPTYSGRVRLTQSGTLKAQLFVGTTPVSKTVAATYTLTARPQMSPSSDDVFDIHQGARVLRTSGLRFSSDGSEMFGGSGGEEPGTTLFGDNFPEGFVHFIEWQTAAPVLLNSINLYASGDDPVFNYEREFTEFTLKARLRTNENFVTVYSFRPNHPYLFLDAASRAILSASFSPVEGLYFRAEFVQRNSGRGYDAPRVIELDGFGSPARNTLGDGIPDSWRMKYFGSVNSPDALAAADPDGDGATNFQEYLDGTNPLVGDALPSPLIGISPLSGSYVAPLNVTINSRGQTIVRYTLDGSDPVATSQAYTGSLTLNTSATVRARLFVNGTPVSAIVGQNYTLRSLQDLPPSAGPSHADAFDIRQGAKVLRTSGVRPGFLPSAMLGNDSPSAETGSTIFQDGRANGFAHFVEFKTASPVLLQKLDLYAAGDGQTYLYEREFASFTLRAKSTPDRADFDLVVATFTPDSHPYQLLDRSNLVYSANVPALSQTPLQYFRAEFVQWNAGRFYDAPRVIELDGFGQLTGGVNPVIADWTFEDGQLGRVPSAIKDYSGNEHAGALIIGAPTFVATAPGVDGSLSLATGIPRDSGFVSGPTLDLNLGEEFTFEALLQPASQAGTNVETIFATLDDSTGQFVYALAYDPEDSVVAFFVLNSSGDAFFLAAPFPADGDSHHLAVVLGSQELTLYIDKSIFADTICPIVPGNTPDGMGLVGIGTLPFTDAPGFRGVLDRVRLSNRVLDPSEFFETQKAQAGLMILRAPVSASAVVGDTVAFSIEASASASISYEWRFNDQLIPGATSNVLLLPNVRLDQAGTYLVTVHAGAEQTSLSARLTVREPDTSQLPVIANQPDSQLIALGSLAQLGVTANSPTPLSYQWYFNGAVLPGATTALLVLPGTTMANAGTYFVDVSNVAGVVRSQGAILDLYDSSQTGGEIYLNNRADGVDAPVTDDAGNRLAGTDYLAQLYAGASGQSLTPVGAAIPFRTGVAAGYFVDPYSRVIPGVPVGGTAFVQIRAWKASAGTTFEQAESAGGLHGASGTFSVTLGGGLTRPAQLAGLESFSLNSGLHITQQPQDVSARVGDSVGLSVQVDGTGPFTYQWRQNGTPRSNATGSFVSIGNVQRSDGGEYTVTVSNGLETVVSAPAVLTILDSSPPVIAITSPGGTTSDPHYTLSGTVSDDTGVTRVEWSKNGTIVGQIPFDNGRFEVSDLTLTAGDNLFRVRAFDAAGNVGTSEITVTLDSNQSVVVPPVAPVQEGERFSVPIILTSLGDVSALSFIISYDTNFLASPDFAWSSPNLAPVQSVDTTTPGVIQALLSLAGQTLPNGDLVLATVEFLPRSVPADLDSLLNLKVTGIYSATGEPILSGTAVRSGKVTIVQRTVTADNNANDRLDVGDASVILRMVDKIDPTRPWDVPLNDINQSKTLDAGDALQVLRAAAHIDPQPRQAGGVHLRALSVNAAPPASGSLALTSDKAQIHAGEQITVRLLVNGRSTPLFGSSFKLEYPATALHLENSSTHRIGSLVPATALTVWNVAPAQTDYVNQNGTLYAAFSNPTAWSANSGELAAFTFTVLGGAASQTAWSLRVSGGELSDGFGTASIPGGELVLKGDLPIPAQLGGATYNAQTGFFSLHLNGVSSARYRLDVSEDLQSWSELGTFTVNSGELYFTDVHSAGHRTRYYRAVQL